MVDAAREALGYAAGASRASIATNRLLVRALVKCIEIIGEAASKVTPETRASLPDVPWPDIIAMRHRLIHTYYDVDLNVVWSTIEVDLPMLLVALEHWQASNTDDATPGTD